MSSKLRVAVHKFTSCDGCQLAFLNAGSGLLALADEVSFEHFAELGVINPGAEVDVAFVEGSVSTPEEVDKIIEIRRLSTRLVTIGACANAGGIQALRNMQDPKAFIGAVYASPEYITSLATSLPVEHYVKVDDALWGCPVSSSQLMAYISGLLQKAPPPSNAVSMCQSCKAKGNPCVLITKKVPCLGPVTKAGCGAICPSFGRGCYGCYGPSENPNTHSLGQTFIENKIVPAQRVADYFSHLNQEAPAFKEASDFFSKKEE